MNPAITAWWRRTSPWARAAAAERALDDALETMRLEAFTHRATQAHLQYWRNLAERDYADLQAAARQLGRAWDARDSARRVAVTLENENRCAIDLLRSAHDALAKAASDPPDTYTRADADLHYWIGAFLRTTTPEGLT